MKSAIIGICAILATCILGQAQEKQITVAANELSGADFSKYRTFGFSPMIIGDRDADIFFLNDLILKSRIREAIDDELMGLGYRPADNPDLLVTFRVFEAPTTLTTVEDQGGSRLWGGSSFSGVGDFQKHEVKAGTLLMSIADRKTSQVVFEGFASGLIDNNRFIKDEVKIREAVNLILTKYGHRVKEGKTN